MFKCVYDLNKLQFRFLQFYDEFEGDVASCLTLHNSYALARLAAVEHNAKKSQKSLHMLNSDVFVTEEVKKNCGEIDNLFLNGLSSVLKNYRCHAEPIVPTSDLLRLIDKAPPKKRQLLDLPVQPTWRRQRPSETPLLVLLNSWQTLGPG